MCSSLNSQIALSQQRQVECMINQITTSVAFITLQASSLLTVSFY